MTEETENLYIQTIRALMKAEEMKSLFTDAVDGYISNEEYEDKSEEINNKYRINYDVLFKPENLELLKPIFKFAFDDITIEQIKDYLS